MKPKFTKGQPVKLKGTGHPAVIIRGNHLRRNDAIFYTVKNLKTGVVHSMIEEHRLEERNNDDDVGLYGKYTVVRVSDPDAKHLECEYFVLDLMHDEFAVYALKAYRDALHRAGKFPELEHDLNAKINEIHDR